MEKIAILGGTFNPIHNAHLILAEYVYSTKEYSKIIFMPSGRPPHKNQEEIIDPVHRYKMCKLAIKGNDHFGISTIELDRNGNTYTVDTIKELKNKFPYYQFSLIIGADALMDLLYWKEPENLFKICNFIVANRYGYNEDKINERIKYLTDNYNAKIKVVEFPNIDISSSMIRERIKNNESIKYLVPKNVEKYIKNYNIYNKADYSNIIEEIQDKLKYKLNEKRYVHSLGVKDTAVKLANIYHCNASKAIVASLLHDCAKNYTNEKKIHLCKKYKIKLTKYEKENPDLIHAKLGAYIAKDKYGINDKEILDAIKYHTTGKPNMTLLEKIVFISDYIEPNRDKAPNLELLRHMSKNDLDKTLIKILEDTNYYLSKKNKKIDPKTKKTLNYYKKLNDKKIM